MRVVVRAEGPGSVEAIEWPVPIVAIHVGRPASFGCRQGDEHYAGVAIQGHVNIVPAGTATSFEMRDAATILFIAINPELLRRVAAETLGHETDDFVIRPRFHTRDLQIEHIGWALKAELEQGCPGGAIYMDSMAMAVAARLVSRHSSKAPEPSGAGDGLPPRLLQYVLEYIEEHVQGDLSVQVIAKLAGLSPSHLKDTFRRSLGVPVHQYVIQRRVDRAVRLLRQSTIPISQIASETGFSHESHLAAHIRRTTGTSPSDVRRQAQTAQR